MGYSWYRIINEASQGELVLTSNNDAISNLLHYPYTCNTVFPGKIGDLIPYHIYCIHIWWKLLHAKCNYIRIWSCLS